MTDGVGPARPQKQSKRLLLTVTFLFRLKPFSVSNENQGQNARSAVRYGMLIPS